MRPRALTSKSLQSWAIACPSTPSPSPAPGTAEAQETRNREHATALPSRGFLPLDMHSTAVDYESSKLPLLEQFFPCRRLSPAEGRQGCTRGDKCSAELPLFLGGKGKNVALPVIKTC